MVNREAQLGRLVALEELSPQQRDNLRRALNVAADELSRMSVCPICHRPDCDSALANCVERWR